MSLGSVTGQASLNKYALHLVVGLPTCTKQIIKFMSAGNYILFIQYYAEKDTKILTSKIGIYINNTIINKFTYNSYQLHHGQLIFKVTQQLSKYPIEFKMCGLLEVTQYKGPMINNVSIYNFEDFYGFQSLVQLQNTYQNIKEIMLQSKFIQNINEIPGSRILLKPIFSFFVNFDKLLLYYYHNREYSQSIHDFLSAINKLQSAKTTNKYKNLAIDFFNLNILFMNTGFKDKYSQKYFPTFWLIEQKSNTFSTNFFYYFFMDTIFIIFIFLIGKILYFILDQMKLQIKSYVNQYKINFFIIFMFLQGNTQIFSYYFATDCLLLFSWNFKLKMVNFVTFVVYFWFVMFMFAGYFLIKYFYQKKDKIV